MYKTEKIQYELFGQKGYDFVVANCIDYKTALIKMTKLKNNGYVVEIRKITED